MNWGKRSKNKKEEKLSTKTCSKDCNQQDWQRLFSGITERVLWYLKNCGY
jgi:hypothetical protein